MGQINCYESKRVKIYTCGEKEAFMWFSGVGWLAFIGNTLKTFVDETGAKEAILKHLEPEWRDAKLDGTDVGRACRVRDYINEQWIYSPDENHLTLLGVCFGRTRPFWSGFVNKPNHSIVSIQCQVQDEKV